MSSDASGCGSSRSSYSSEPRRGWSGEEWSAGVEGGEGGGSTLYCTRSLGSKDQCDDVEARGSMGTFTSSIGSGP
jgi:hypothetical protein